MSVSGSETVRIWLVDKLYPDMSFDCFSRFAENFASEIYEYSSRQYDINESYYTKLKQEYPYARPNVEKPIDKKLVMDNGDIINIKEINIEGFYAIPEYVDDADINIQYIYFSDTHSCHGNCLTRIVRAPNKKQLLYVMEDEHRTKENEEIEIHGIMFARRKWIDENPDWDFEKLVRDELPRLLIESELDYGE